MRKMRFVMPLVFLALALVVGCAKPPQEAVDTAKQALAQAQSAGAADYAPAALKSAQDAVDQLDAELAAQQKKFALFRSYKNAMTLAATAKSAGESAVAEANTGKEKARGEAEAAIAAAKQSAEEARSMLATAPAGKGSQMDIEAMKNDLTGVDTSIGEADQAMQAQQYLQAKSKADAANTAAQNIKSMIDQAAQMKAGAKKGKSM